MRETFKDAMLLLAEKFYSLVESFYRRANEDRSRNPNHKQKGSKNRLQALAIHRLFEG